MQGKQAFFPTEISVKSRQKSIAHQKSKKPVGVLEKHNWIIISDQNVDHLKTHDKKEMLCSAMPDRKNWVKELFFTLFVTHKI